MGGGHLREQPRHAGEKKMDNYSMVNNGAGVWGREFEPPSYNNNNNPKKYEILNTRGGGYCAIHALIGGLKLIGRRNINLNTVQTNLRGNLKSLNNVKVRVIQKSWDPNFSSNATETLREDEKEVLRIRLNSSYTYYGIEFDAWASYYYNIKIVIYYDDKKQIQTIQKICGNYKSKNTVYILRSGTYEHGKGGHFETLRPKTGRIFNNNRLALSLSSRHQGGESSRRRSGNSNNNNFALARELSLIQLQENNMKERAVRESLKNEIKRHLNKLIVKRKTLNKKEITEIDRLLSKAKNNSIINNTNKVKLLVVLKNSVESGKINSNDIKRFVNIIKFLSKDKKWIKGFKNEEISRLLNLKYLKILNSFKLLNKYLLERFLRIALNKGNQENVNLILKLQNNN